jgi:hypothetical protein
VSSELSDKIKQDYSTNTWLINQLTDGLTHQESLLQLQFNTNCMNWVLGHILSQRNHALDLLGSTCFWDDVTMSLYRTGSEPVIDGGNARPFELLQSDIEMSQVLLDEALDGSSQIALERIIEIDRGTKPIWQHLKGLHWHETYHIGQLEILRAYAYSTREGQDKSK